MPGGDRVSPIAGYPDSAGPSGRGRRPAPATAAGRPDRRIRNQIRSAVTDTRNSPRYRHPTSSNRSAPSSSCEENGVTVAGGAIRRYDDRNRRSEAGVDVAPASPPRAGPAGDGRTRGRRGQSRLPRMHLTTGPRQPEARSLYLASGYTPRFDATADPETIGPLAFGKEIVPGAGLPDWNGSAKTSDQACNSEPVEPAAHRPAPSQRLGREDRSAGSNRRHRRSPARPHQTGQRAVSMSPGRHRAIAFVGGGPRTVCLLERLSANASELLGPDPVHIHIIDPHPAGGGRIWRDRPVGIAVDELDGP